MSSVSTTAGDVKILITLKNLAFTSMSILRFDVFNAMNTIPTGEFVLADKGSDFVIANSGDYGVIYFTDTSDTNMEKASAIPFIIDEMTQVEQSGADTAYKIKWTAGTKESLRNSTRAFKGTSLEALVDICEYHDYKALDLLSKTDFEKPSDSMTWRYIQDSMWESFDTVISKSYMKNDFLFWAFDDVNNCIKISTLNLERALDNSHLFMFADNASSSKSEVKKRLTEPAVTIWTYNGDSRANELGKNRKKLFPNISFSGVGDTDLNQAGFRKGCFSSVLKSMGDDKQSEIQDITDLKDPNDVFGDLQVRRHWPNNTHKMYSLSDVYRDYKMATYGKVMYVRVYNTIGPAIGTKASILALNNDLKVRGANVDTTYTDTYILAEKQIRFTTVERNNTGRLKGSGNDEMVTILKFVSDNYGTSGLEDTMKFINTMKEVK